MNIIIIPELCSLEANILAPQIQRVKKEFWLRKAFNFLKTFTK